MDLSVSVPEFTYPLIILILEKLIYTHLGPDHSKAVVLMFFFFVCPCDFLLRCFLVFIIFSVIYFVLRGSCLSLKSYCWERESYCPFDITRKAGFCLAFYFK